MKLFAVCAIAVLPLVPCYAEWQLIDDFEQSGYEPGDYYGPVIGWNVVTTGEYSVVFDAAPADPDNLLIFVAPEYAPDLKPVYLSKHLPGKGIEPGSTGTIFMRLMFGDGLAWRVGVTDVNEEIDPETGTTIRPGSFSDFNCAFEISWAIFAHIDNGETIVTNPPYYAYYNSWYEVYIVIENTFSEDNFSTGSYKLYIRSPDSLVPELILVGTDPSSESALFSRYPLDDDGNPRAISSILWEIYIVSSVNGIEGAYAMDDFYFFPGENLSNPLLTFSGFIIDENNDTDTENWMGWLNLSHAPWLWSYTLNGWLYMEEPDPWVSGQWAYFLK